MKTKTNSISIETMFSEDLTNRYYLQKVWNKDKPQALIISKSAGSDDGIYETLTQTIITNNLYSLGYGGFCLCNLFSSVDGKKSDKDNIKIIKELCSKKFDSIIICWGNLSASSEEMREQESAVLKTLYSSKKELLAVSSGKSINCHPLHPSVRKGFILVPLTERTETNE